MKLLLYFPKSSDSAERLLRHVDSCPALRQAKLYRSIPQLSGLLSRLNFTAEETITVLFASNHQDLSGLLSIGDLLKKARVILVLPNAEKETICVAHQLMPRYIGYADGDLADVAAVLEKMIQHLN